MLPFAIVRNRRPDSVIKRSLDQLGRSRKPLKGTQKKHIEDGKAIVNEVSTEKKKLYNKTVTFLISTQVLSGVLNV